jgi:3-deoxy-7-phosphoheptulonate synthase
LQRWLGEKEVNEMIVVLKDNPDQKQLDNLVSWLKSMGLDIHFSQGSSATIMGLIGDTASVDIDLINALDIVETVKRVQEPYKNVNRKFHPQDTVVEITPDIKIGGGNFQVIAGPCSVESEEQVCLVADAVKEAGAGLYRGGAFKPRTSPYAFQGMRDEGIKLLLEAKEKSGLPIVTEVMDISHLPLFEDVDVIQVGARNMQNFELLKELGKIDKPILLKRGLSSTLKELLMSAEYIMAGGNEKIILCERGIRTFETATRNTLDLASIPLLKTMTHLPIIVDPSHATGIASLVKPMAMAATAAGADGLMIEVHNNPSAALCDGAQSLTPEAFADVMNAVNAIRPVAYKG